MKFLFWLLGLFALAVALVLAAHNPGYVLIAYPPYRVDLSLTLFTALMIALLISILLAIKLLNSALRLPEQVRQFRARRALEKQQASTREALTAYFEGRLASAENAAARAIELGDSNPFLPIIAARSAHELRKFDQRDAYLAIAEKDEQARIMHHMAAAEFCLERRNPEAALEVLKSLRKSNNTPIAALRLELRAQQQAENWSAVLELADQLEKRNAIDSVHATQLRRQAWLECLRNSQDITSLQSTWKSIPAAARLHTRITETAVRAFMQLNDARTAKQIVTNSLEENWDSHLAEMYGDIATDDVLGQIEQAERWLQKHRNDAGLLLTLGKLCLRQNLWGKAQTYLDASISMSPTYAGYMLLGELAEKLQKPNDAFNYFRKAMALQHN